MSPTDSIVLPDGRHANILASFDVDLITSRLDDCWNRIGVFGQRSCPELLSCVHCRNCSVYSAAGHSLFERLPPSALGASNFDDFQGKPSQFYFRGHMRASAMPGEVPQEVQE